MWDSRNDSAQEAWRLERGGDGGDTIHIAITKASTAVQYRVRLRKGVDVLIVSGRATVVPDNGSFIYSEIDKLPETTACNTTT